MTATENAAGPWDASGLHSVGRLPMRALRRTPDIELDGTWDFQLLPSPTAPWCTSTSHTAASARRSSDRTPTRATGSRAARTRGSGV
ncbi:hypothetical protein SAMN04487983_1017115 [Streptomyces sp. yr375]|uniref:hypothetical protein n=1 Tax=Streptomyces sp. yr375 TaxID=1761906 RepID=UPI0008BE0E48|nr:hypothetical protein SAMN04487983_1017115 [Streptomyces sp. yr375]